MPDKLMEMHRPEPFKIKSVSPIKMLTRQERQAIIKKAHYNSFKIQPTTFS